MTYPDPPSPLPAPAIAVVPAGTTVWRIHQSIRGAADLNPTPRPRAAVGGRFDSRDGSYSYLYIADSPAAAVAETLCRRLPVAHSPRLIPRASIAGRTLTSLVVTEDLHVADLTGAGSARINAGSWLTHSDPAHYLVTRAWASAVLTANPDIAGLQYRPRHDDNRLSWVLTSHPSAGRHGRLAPKAPGVELDTAIGRAVLSPLLAAHNAALA